MLQRPSLAIPEPPMYGNSHPHAQPMTVPNQIDDDVSAGVGGGVEPFDNPHIRHDASHALDDTGVGHELAVPRGDGSSQLTLSFRGHMNAVDVPLPPSPIRSPVADSPPSVAVWPPKGVSVERPAPVLEQGDEERDLLEEEKEKEKEKEENDRKEKQDVEKEGQKAQEKEEKLGKKEKEEKEEKKDDNGQENEELSNEEFTKGKRRRKKEEKKLKEEEVNRCQIQEWYPKFKSVSIKTLIHELPQSFIEYLLDDSGPFLLPISVTNEDALPNRIHNPHEEDDYQVFEGSDDESEQPSLPPSFPELELAIKDSIETLGGAVFPKMNWSAPKDSSWISTTGTLKCTSFIEIVLLLRSSDSLVHDLCHAYDSCIDKTSLQLPCFVLALRKWYQSLRPDMEFRCFVKNRKLIGISQREITTFYPVLVERKSEIRALIGRFFVENVKEKFESENYTFDVYVRGDERVKVMDFNPWCGFTLPLMFTWEELEQSFGEEEEEEEVEMRIVESRREVRPGLKTAVPYDFLDMSPGSGWDQFLRNADQELRHQSSSSEAGA